MSFFTPFAFVKQAPGGVIPGPYIQATGGTITFDENYKIHTFTTSGNFNIQALGTDPTYGNKVEYLIVGGGGSGGSAGFSEFGAGGGGAGGFLTGTGRTVTAQNYSITVGTGGNKVAAGRNTGNDGGSSIFDGLTAVGGGGGGSSNGGQGRDGGSGGGAGGLNGTTVGGQGTVGQGNNGGSQSVSGDPYGGAGGGGALEAGGQSNNNGVGGNGKASSITGTSVTYAGGGSGGETFAPPFAAGTGGGGTGGILSTNGSNGTDGLGGGGGGGGNDGSGAGTQGGDGGDGVVIIRYPYEWAPSLMTGNAYWWRADAGVALSGTTVTSWTDQKAGAVLTGTGTPTFASSIAGMNSQPGITFNTSDRLTLNSLANPQNSSSDSLVFWWIIDTGTNGSGGYQVLGGAAVGGTGEWVFETNNPSFANSYTNYFFNWLGFPNGDKNYGVSVQATERAWVANQYNPNPAGTATANMFRAGVLLSTVTGNAAGGKEATLNLNVGNYSSPDNLFFIGNILEFGINGKELTSDDLTKMNAYCQARYGI